MTASTNNAWVALITAAATLLGAASTPFISWLSDKTAAESAQVATCLKRVDTDQDAMRLKGEMFLKAIANFQSVVGDPITSENSGDRLNAARAATKTINEIGWGLGAYTGPELANASIELAITVDSMSQGTPEKRNEAASKTGAQLSKWINLYQKTDASFESRRAACHLDPSSHKG